MSAACTASTQAASLCAPTRAHRLRAPCSHHRCFPYGAAPAHVFISRLCRRGSCFSSHRLSAWRSSSVPIRRVCFADLCTWRRLHAWQHRRPSLRRKRAHTSFTALSAAGSASRRHRTFSFQVPSRYGATRPFLELCVGDPVLRFRLSHPPTAMSHSSFRLVGASA